MFMCILALMTVGEWWKKFLSACLSAWVHRFRLYRLSLSVAKTNRLIWEAKWALEFNNKPIDEEKLLEYKTLIERREKYHQDAQSSCWSEAMKEEYTVK
jgi:hypothetical protein